MKKNIFVKFGVLLATLTGMLFVSSCSEEPDGSNLYDASELSIAQMLEQDEDLTGFTAILNKTIYGKLLGTWGHYTCFAPVNEGVSSYLDSLYNDNSYLTSKQKVIHNGIKETAGFENLSVVDKVALLPDSLCTDIAKYHLSGEVHNQTDLDGTETTWSTMLTGRSISVNTFLTGKYAGMTSLNDQDDGCAIIDGDKECINGVVHKLSNAIRRSDRIIDEQISTEKDLTIFYAALQATGLNEVIQAEKKDTTYTLASSKPTDRDGVQIYCPTECQIKWTVFAETDEVFKAAGINSLDDLIDKCIDWYGGASAWYDYLNEMGITVNTGRTPEDLKQEFNVLHMFVAYHILRAGMPVDKIVYEYNSSTSANWNFCFGYEPQEYFETMLKNTLLKVWETNPKSTKELWINRYRKNNTLTDELGTFGSDDTHPIIFKGVQIDRNSSKETLNGYIHRITGILKYDENAKNALYERLRLDSSTFLYELINNGIRGATVSEVSALNGGGDGNRVAFDPKYFDNIVCYNPSTLLRFCVQGAWRAHNSDQFQGWDVYDLAFKLPHVPSGEYELRLVYPPMQRGGLMQFYIGTSSDQGTMKAIGIPFDARTDPTQDGNVMGCEQILTTDDDPETDYGLASDQVMHVRGYMRAPASFSRGTYNTITDKLSYNASDPYSAASKVTGSTSCRSEWGYGTMMLRYVVTTINIKQSEDTWFRIKNLINDADLGWSFDFIELVPTGIVNNQNMSEDWY